MAQQSGTVGLLLDLNAGTPLTLFKRYGRQLGVCPLGKCISGEYCWAQLRGWPPRPGEVGAVPIKAEEVYPSIPRQAAIHVSYCICMQWMCDVAYDEVGNLELVMRRDVRGIRCAASLIL